jgi:hypothetical protein
MSCTKHVLGIQVEHHTWRPRVLWAETRSARETDMWGRVNVIDSVTCHKQQVCEACGEIRDGADCMCDPEEAERCALRIACLATPPVTAA